MSYTVHLYGHHGNAFAEQMKTSPSQVIERVEAWAKSKRVRGQSLERGMKYVRELFATETPARSRECHFEALCWVGDAVMERIKLPEFSELSRYSDIVEYGIVPGLLQHPTPYPLPRSRESPPVAGYLPWEKMGDFLFQGVGDSAREAMEQIANEVDRLLAGFSRRLLGKDIAAPERHRLSREQIDYARQQFKGVLESLAEEQLDLLAVIL